MFYNMFLHFLLLNLYKNPTVTFIRGTKESHCCSMRLFNIIIDVYIIN